MRRLWTERLEALPDGDAELRAFGIWFASGAFNDTDGLQLLKRTVAKTNATVDDAPGVLEALATVAATQPTEALEAAAPIALNMAAEFMMVTSEVRGLLSAALATGDPDARQEAEKLIDDLAWRQVHGLRDVLD